MQITQPENFTSRNRTIKHNHLYLVDDFQGNIPLGNGAGLGLYHLDTRFLSGFDIKLHGTEPIPLLSSTEMGYLSTIVFTNGPITTTDDKGGEYIANPETVQLKRETALFGAQYERYVLTNYNNAPINISVTFQLDADFRDMFDIRGIVQIPPGKLSPPVWVADDADPRLIFSYKDRTGRYLETRVRFVDQLPTVSIDGPNPVIQYDLLLPPREPVFFNFEIHTIVDDETEHDHQQNEATLHGSSNGNGNRTHGITNMDEALSMLNFRARQPVADMTRFISDNDDFNEMMMRNEKDMRMLITHTDAGSYVAAGIPWYVALFGRDSIITSRFCLPVNPDIARDTLKILAKFQGTERNDDKDEQPGKILHELRVGELAKMGEIPHTPYYGSVDSTPLWIVLLYDYFTWTGDKETLQQLWPNAIRAMDWIDENLKDHKLGYCTYETLCERGIYQQGWKDSHDSITDEWGTVGKAPIALAEVQGYVYLAKRRMAAMADFLGEKELRQRLRKECVEFRKKFCKDFWMPKLNFAAIAVDKEGKKFRIISTNPGHCLETGIFYESQAEQVMERLMSPEMYSGWGIRTLSANAAAYNPMSYHNGSVWPHDNAMVAKGFAAYGRSDLVEKVFTGLFEAARHMFYKRLPELFCGFRREEGKEGDPPVRYAVACSPQAWAAATMYSLMQSMLGLEANALKKSISIKTPHLPAWMNFLEVQNLRVGTSVVDLEFRRTDGTVMVNVKNRRGELSVTVEV